MKNSKQSAYPTYPPQHNGLGQEEYSLNYGENGLTKREYFAAMAMQGLLSNPNVLIGANPLTIASEINIASIEHADDLLLELEKQNT